MSTVDDVAGIISDEVTRAVERCEFDDIIGEDGVVDVEAVSLRVAERLHSEGKLA